MPSKIFSWNLIIICKLILRVLWLRLYLINITYLWYEFKFNLKDSREDAQRFSTGWMNGYQILNRNPLFAGS